MAAAAYRGFTLKTAGNSTDVWQVQIKIILYLEACLRLKRALIGFVTLQISLIQKNLDLSVTRKKLRPSSRDFHGYTLKNDNGNPNEWYCFFNGKLIKGGKVAMQKHIEAYLVAKQKAEQQQKK